MKKYFTLLFFSCITSISVYSQSPVLSLAKMEKEFSDYCLANGGPEAWSKYFVSDGIMFNPLPVNAIEFMKPRLGSKRPRINKLVWEACFSDISSSGDFGYNIGPSVISNIKYDTVPNQYGFIFSVWKKINDTTWRVAIDAGIGINEKTDFHQLQGKHSTPSVIKPGKLTYTYLEAENRFIKTAGEINFLTAYNKNLSDEAKMLKNEWGLYDGKQSILNWFEMNDRKSMMEQAELKIIGSGSSKSEDLAFTYGSYKKLASNEDGLFVHLWKRINGQWYLVMDVTGTLPK